MTITEQQRPNLCRNNFSKYRTKKDKYNNEYFLDGQTFYVKFFTHNKWFIIKDIDYRHEDFSENISNEIFLRFGFDTLNFIQEIFEKEGIL